MVGLGRLPFGWKYSLYICQRALVQLVEAVPPPPNILLVRYLDDFLLVHHDRRYLRRHTGGGRGGGFIVSPKSVLDPSTQLVFLADVCGVDTAHGMAFTEAGYAVLLGVSPLAGTPPRCGMPLCGGGVLLAA